MSIASAVGSVLRTLGHSVASAPATPTLAVVNAGTGTSATATITGSDAGATVTLYYRAGLTGPWTAGSSRTGNGTISQTGLTAGAYQFIAVANVAGCNSIPSNGVSRAIRSTPASSMIVNVRDAVRDELNAVVFSQSFTATATFLPEFRREELSDLTVTVVAKDAEAQAVYRVKVWRDVQIDIAVQKALPADDSNAATAGPGLMALVEEIYEHFELGRLNEYTNAAWLRTVNRPIYSPQHIAEAHVFTSVITLTFKVME